MSSNPDRYRPAFYVFATLLLAFTGSILVARYGVTGRLKGRVFFKPDIVEPDLTLSVFPGRAPAPFDSADDVPTLYGFFPPRNRANGTAVIVCPGGGYRTVGLYTEGQDSVRWLTKLGITVFVLKYSVKPHLYPDSTLEAKRCVRILRAQAREWRLDPNKIGLAGYSAGGHVASTVGTHFDLGNPEASDPVERQSCRPDFLILGYAVTTMKVTTGQHSRENLLGDPPPEELIRLLSNELHVTPQTPPTFMMHTAGDPSVSVQQTHTFYQALQDAGVPSRKFILEEGGHGAYLIHWIGELTDWLEKSQLIPIYKPEPAAPPKPNRP